MVERRFPLPDTPQAVERARAALAGELEAAPARPAATVMVVREAGAGALDAAVLTAAGVEAPASAGVPGAEVFVLKRVSTMAFAPSTYVFPGGGVDPRDATPDLPWAGPSRGEWAALMDVSDDEAEMLVVAAIREVFEECGVLLAGDREGAPLVDVRSDDWAARRAALVAHEASLAEVLTEAGLVARTDLLSYRAHWITPTFEPRRYDTHFFAALLPDGQAADDATTEADHARWVRPADLLEQAAAGRARILPPTLICLEALAATPSAAAFLAERPPTSPIQPELVTDEDGAVWLVSRHP
ncbi:NUDIX hydrolase [Janibacter sp. G56]|uniref:NUDIX hydrolase n=1 Tax=Janibacter sp. G56 TaxID=3418717 RepID=UPI003D06FA2E